MHIIFSINSLNSLYHSTEYTEYIPSNDNIKIIVYLFDNLYTDHVPK